MQTNKFFTRFIKFFFKVVAVLFPLFAPAFCRAMPPGTLLYRTTDDGKMYGYSGDPLIEAPGGIIKGINPGHVAIYIGKEDGVDYVVEALAGGIVKLPAKYFVNLDQGEEFLGALVPEAADALDRAKAVAIAKSLAEMKLAYDFDFKKQKGPGSGEWTCVGLTEKVYESAALANPNNLTTLEYDPNKYAVDITPDGFDNYSFINKAGDCFSREYEFSKISRREDLLLPAPELVGFNAGLEYEGERYIFLPYTQFLQPTLKEVAVDIDIASSFSGEEIRGKAKTTGIILRWSLINNPLSSLKIAVKEAKDSVTTVVSKISQKLFSDDSTGDLVLGGDDLARADTDTTKTASAAGATKEKNILKIIVNKAGPTVGRGASGSWAEETSVESESKESDGALKKTGSGGSGSADSKNSAKTALTIKEAIAALYDPPGVKEALAAAAEATEVEEKEALGKEAGLAANEIYPAANEIQENMNESVVSSSFSGSSGGGSSHQENIVWPEILINRIYATGDDDWIELYNPTDSDFDLAAAGYRLERTKTAEDPSLAMRIGNAADGAYPGGTIIKAKGYYLIVRDDAGNYYRNQADAIATRDEFSWTGSGYTLYLGLGAISSNGDSDLIDAVGYGAEATYFQGNGPAPEIADNYVLSRLSQYGNNSLDFALILSDDPAILAALAAAETENEGIGENETGESEAGGGAGETGENQETEEATDAETESETGTGEAATTETGSGAETETGTSAETESEAEAESEAEVEVEVPLALISKIYATGDDDWVELYNPTDSDFDLAIAGYRLEKTKTAVDPSLIMRIGDIADGTYPGGTIIKAKDYYLIVRDDASDYYLSRADAIATRDEFSWTESGYTLYLGIGAISASDDPDIIDAVAYGADATYVQGNGPAPEISDNYFLDRNAWSGDNAADFHLSPAEDPIAAAALAAASSDDGAPSTEETDSATEEEEETDPTTELEDKNGLTLIRSDGLINLWHFDECYGEGSWAVGRWDCARVVGGYNNDFTAALSPAADLNGFSLAFDYKKAGNSPRLTVNLKNDEADRVIFTLESGLITIKGLPETENRYYLNVPFDEEWHQAVLTVNWAKDYWAVYLDGELAVFESFTAVLPTINGLSAGGTAGAVLMDEVAVWKRPLSETEIAFINNSAAPFSPLSPREAKIIPELKYHWGFSEGTGATALDNVSGTTLDLPGGAWTARAHDNYALSTVYNKTYTADFSSALVSRDISLAFWWRNSAYPQEGRANIFLGNHIFSLLTNYYRPAYWFNNSYGIISQGTDMNIPNDDAWHHLAFVYDSHDYRLRFYVDGEETKTIPLIWWPPETAIQDLKITSDGQSSALDDLKIWRGALSAEQVREIYANN